MHSHQIHALNASFGDHLKEAKEYGIELTGEPKLNWGSFDAQVEDRDQAHQKASTFSCAKTSPKVISGWGSSPDCQGRHPLRFRLH